MNKYTPRAVSAEVVNAGKCNLNCAYCYIPKTKEMDSLHADVVSYLKSGKFIGDLLDLYGDSLEAFSLWGTEPTLTLDYVTKWLPKLFETFPKLKASNFSSNFMLDTDCMIRFIQELPRGRDFSFSVQYSIDGPEYITDTTRHKNATKRIKKNIKKFAADVNDLQLDDISLLLHCKPTWNSDIIRMVGSDLNKVSEFLEFFNEFYGEVDSLITNPQVTHTAISEPYLALPGAYTVDDGKLWAVIEEEFFRLEDKQRQYKIFPNLRNQFEGYVPRLQRILDYGREFYIKPEMFSCSAGDTQYSLDHKGYIHPCHRTFYMNDDRYVKSIVKADNKANWDLDHFKSNKIKDIRRTQMVHIDDEYECRRIVYANTGHHYFLKTRINILRGYIKLLTLSGQINEVYKNKEMELLFAEFLTTAFSCPFEYDVSLGNNKLLPLGMIRLWGNGAFELAIKRIGEKVYE